MKPRFRIATSLCAGSAGDRSDYPQLGGLRAGRRRRSFWKCVAVFFASGRRCNPDAELMLFTNDRKPPVIDGVNVGSLLAGWGVSIVQTPFTFMPPRHASGSFRNTYFKLDAVKALGAYRDDFVMHLDADCLWTRPGDKLRRYAESDRLTLYAVYGRPGPAEKAGDLTGHEMAALYRRIDPGYPESAPVRFGGELIAGRGEWFAEIDSQLTDVFAGLVQRSRREPPRFANGRTVFDGEEYLSCFVLNKFWGSRWQDAAEYVKRIWDTNVYSNASPDDLGKTVWHMPAEKQRGFPLLFREVVSPDSEFFHVPLDRFAAYLGEFVGIPERKRFYREQGQVERMLEPLRKMLRGVKRRVISRAGKEPPMNADGRR